MMRDAGHTPNEVAVFLKTAEIATLVYVHSQVVRTSASTIDSETLCNFVTSASDKLSLISDCAQDINGITADGLDGDLNVNDPGAFFQRHLKWMQMGEVWRLAFPHVTRKVKVAVLDSGINWTDPDLAPLKGKLKRQSGGYLEGGWNCFTKTSVMTDGFKHGTYTARILAAKANNSVGMAPNVTLVPLQMLDDAGSGGIAPVLEALNMAIDLKVDIASMSFSIDPDLLGMPQKRLFWNGLRSAQLSGILLVSSAGNLGLLSIPSILYFLRVVSRMNPAGFFLPFLCASPPTFTFAFLAGSRATPRHTIVSIKSGADDVRVQHLPQMMRDAGHTPNQEIAVFLETAEIATLGYVHSQVVRTSASTIDSDALCKFVTLASKKLSLKSECAEDMTSVVADGLDGDLNVNDPGAFFQRHLKWMQMVAVLDSGINWTDPDLAPLKGKLKRQSGGYLEGGWNCFTKTSDLTPLPHGTYTNRILAAKANNSVGIAGVAPNVTLVPLQLLKDSPGRSLSPVLEALNMAIDLRVDIASMSFGIHFTRLGLTQKSLLWKALRSAQDSGVSCSCPRLGIRA
ncbi:hypothetical protein FOZ60_008953 [Perkinsus olseni]|uniref:subtilisin n=1 Tax=Perkinsus olseni TaxID=32597 RepID=A0A7J6PDE0_PEROL|nr:hypothetical protein FOZ60_008953 [Perkinsus olseni]